MSRYEKKHPCFRCGRNNPECEGVRNYRKQKKSYGYDVNDKEEIEALLKKQKKDKETKEAKRNLSRSDEGREIIGANYSDIYL